MAEDRGTAAEAHKTLTGTAKSSKETLTLLA